MANIQYDKNIDVKKDIAQVDIEVKVKPSEYARIWDMAADKLAKSVTMQGFRKGHAPANAVRSAHSNQISQNAFDDMVQTIVQDVVAGIEEKPISAVRINVKEHDDSDGHTDHNHDIEFTLSYAIRIDPKLPKMEDIKVERKNQDVSDEEIKQSLEMLMKSINDSPAKEGETKEEITEWTDENVSKLNMPEIKTVEDLKNLVKSEVSKQKAYENEMVYRAQILDEVVSRSNVVLPQIILEDMMNQQEEDYKARIEKLGFEYDAYIAEKNISIEDLKKDWKKMISDDLSRELILSQYVTDNNIVVTEEEIDKAIQTADQQLKERYTPEGLRKYMEYMISNNIAFGKIYAIVSEDEKSKD